MAKLSYTSIASLDGYIEDADGTFGWAMPDEEVHAFVNDLERAVGTHLYGRGLYETMVAWETLDPGESPAMRDYAEIWRASDKVVYSRTLDAVSSERTRIEREFDPGAVRALKEQADRDISIGGPGLAAAALRAGLVDECRLLLAPVAVGAGKPVFPAGARIDLELLEESRFAGGFVHLHYRVAT